MTLTPTDTQTDAQTDAQPDVPAGQSDPTAPTRVWGWLDDPRARKVANSAAAIFFGPLSEWESSSQPVLQEFLKLDELRPPV